jgi:hypothetical protein
MTSDRNPIEIGLGLIEATDQAGLTARLLGGVAVAIHSPTASTPEFRRTYDDIDIVIDKRSRKRIDEALATRGFEPDVEFNNLHGRERRTYYSAESGKLDVFIGEFSMCHTLSFDGRLEIDHPTVALADLFLTKAQIFELNRKDAMDLLTLLADHQVGAGDDDTINLARITEVCCADWGTWRTVTRTFDTLDGLVQTAREPEGRRDVIRDRLSELRAGLECAPKSAKWKMRAKVGDRKIWYQLPEDEDRQPAIA